MVSYDDATSFSTPHARRSHWCSLTCVCHSAAKGQYINSAGLAGFTMWTSGGDYNDILLDAICSGAGINYSG